MSWMHYRALLFKNWILWKRRLLGSLCELLIPIFFFAVLTVIRYIIPAEEEDERSYLQNAVYLRPDASVQVDYPFAEASAFAYCQEYIGKGGAWTIGLAPRTAITEYLESKILGFPALNGITVTYFTDNEDIDDYTRSSSYEDGPKFCAAIVFSEYTNNKYEYYIRYNQTETFPDNGRPIGDFIDIFWMNKYHATDDLISEPKPEFQRQFMRSGFSLIQNWVDNYLLQQITADPNAYIAPAFVPMYHSDWVEDDLLPLFKENLPLVLVLVFLVPISRMLSSIVQEKEYKIKEMMAMMGLSNFAYWMSWVTYYIVVYTIIAASATFFVGYFIFKNSNLAYVFLIFFLFGISCMCFGLLVSIFFSKAKTALTIGLMIFMGTFFVIFAVDDQNGSGNDKVMASVIPSIAFTLSLNVLAEYEIGGLGINSSTFNREVLHYKFSTGVTFLAFDIFVMILAILYFEQVWPNEWGTKRPWYFLFTHEFWAGGDSVTNEDFESEVKYGSNVEPTSQVLEEQKKNGKCMMLRNLTKQFGNHVAVNGLNIDIYEDQILALLGHNGAGKTTTISMLTGLIPPSSGEMKIGNLVLTKDMEKIRKKLGVCPQQNVLFNELTPEEHLYLYSVFKGETDQGKISRQIHEILKSVSLLEHKDKNSEFLSGGQKRKLSLAIALIGDSKIILLDEPTSGMDLSARRLMWDMLKEYKTGRIIILTTHYMQEADVLADRIAILSHGKLRCLGSSLFLKSKYGVGYLLVIVKEEHANNDQIIDFVKKFVPEAKITDEKVDIELKFSMPLTATDSFQAFFEALDSQKEELKYKAYGVSVTTLEEVFIRVAKGSDEEIKKSDLENKESKENYGESQKLIETERETKGLFWRHMVGLIVKRSKITSRDFRSIIFEFVVPISLVVIGIVLILIADRFVDADPYLLVIDQYETPQNLLYNDNSGYSQQLVTFIDQDSDVTVTYLESGSISDFDLKVYENRNVDPTRMGSYYFYSMNGELNQYEPVIFHNQTAFQSLATYSQLVSLSILQVLDPSISIKCNNYPLPVTEKMSDTEGAAGGVLGCLVFGLAFSFIPGAIIAYIVREREESVKHQHMITGVSLWAYWISNYVWDWVKYLPVMALAGALIMAFDVRAFTEDSETLRALWALLVLLGPPLILFTYSSSFLFQDYSSAQVGIIVFQLTIGSILPIVNYILYLFEETRYFVKVFRWFCRLIPGYCLGNGILYLGSVQAMEIIDNKEGTGFSAFDLGSAGGDILMLSVDTLLYFVVLLVLEIIETNPSLRKIFDSAGDLKIGEFEPDEDVQAEENRALNSKPEESQINVRKLRKVYGGFFRPSNVAVESVSFNVNKSDSFALLGVNGAGKTSTFRMLTGEYPPTSGEAYLGGFSVLHELDKARENIGYCPQFDALNELLTCEEHLKLYSEIKGINKSLIEELVTDLLNDLDLSEYRHFPAGTLSGGNKRKLSVAISLIGNPSVVFLDEPSAGMDPETRKKLWNVLASIKDRGAAVILTTHSMEEAEALCKRLAIMVAGRLRCIGTPTYLRDKFGKGFEVEIKVHLPDDSEVAEISQQFQHVLGNESDINFRNFEQCLKEINAEKLVQRINEKGSGSAIFQQLKSENKFPRDSFASWALMEIYGDNILEWLKKQVAEVKLIEHYLGLYRFKIAKEEDKSIGFLFSLIEKNKENMKICEYAISPTTLDQIFAGFAAEDHKNLRNHGDE